MIDEEEKKFCSEWQKDAYVGSQVFQKQNIRMRILDCVQIISWWRNEILSAF